MLGMRMRYLGLRIYRGNSAAWPDTYPRFGHRSLRTRLTDLLQRFLGKAAQFAIEVDDEEALNVIVAFSPKLGSSLGFGATLGTGIVQSAESDQWARADKLLKIVSTLKQYGAHDAVADGPSAASLRISQGALAALDRGDLGKALKLSTLALELHSSDDNRFYQMLLTSLASLKKEAENLARPLRQSNSHRDRNVFSAVVWGDEYIDYFMAYTVRSMLAPGNLPSLRDQLSVFSIITTPLGAERIRAHSSFAPLAAEANVVFFLFPDELTQRFHYSRPNFDFYRLYGALDHTSIHLARALEANIFFVVVDAVVSNNTLQTLRRYVEEGYDICANASIVSKRETFTPALDLRYGKDGPIDIDARDLATLGFEYRHDYISQRLVIESNQDFDKYPRELYFPVAEGLVVHALYQHPLVVSAKAICKDIQFDYFIVDSKLMSRIFSDPRDFQKLKVIVDSDEAYVANFAPASRRFDTTGRALDAEDFASVHTQSEPIHHYIWQHRQLLRCTTGLQTNRDPEEVAVKLLEAVRKVQGAA